MLKQVCNVEVVIDGILDDNARCVLHTAHQVTASGRSGGHWLRLAMPHKAGITSYNSVIG